MDWTVHLAGGGFSYFVITRITTAVSASPKLKRSNFARGSTHYALPKRVLCYVFQISFISIIFRHIV